MAHGQKARSEPDNETVQHSFTVTALSWAGQHIGAYLITTGAIYCHQLINAPTREVGSLKNSSTVIQAQGKTKDLEGVQQYHYLLWHLADPVNNTVYSICID